VQVVVLERALEYDHRGELCWREIMFLAPRRAGKSVLLTEWLLWRAFGGKGVFDEFQTCLHLAKDLKLARSTQAAVWRWADAQGLSVRRSNGQETIAGDVGAWHVSSQLSVYGWESGLAVVDEAWAMTEESYDQGLMPTQIGREKPQALLMSMPHEASSTLVPSRRAAALDPVGNQVMIAQWSAPLGADDRDPKVWLAAAPFLNDAYRRDIVRAAQMRPAGFREQWLGIWPRMQRDAVGWPLGFGEVGRLTGPAPTGGLVVVEQSLDAAWVSLVVGRGGPGGVELWFERCVSMGDALERIRQLRPERVACGITLKATVDPHAGGGGAFGCGGRETQAGTAWFAEAVRRGQVRHDGQDALVAQAAVARVVKGERGIVLSQKRSGGPVEGLKACIWATWLLMREPTLEEPGVF
jgi:hypothetical protein